MDITSPTPQQRDRADRRARRAKVTIAGMVVDGAVLPHARRAVGLWPLLALRLR